LNDKEWQKVEGARLMTIFLLLRQGYDFMKYTSIEMEIENRKKEYY